MFAACAHAAAADYAEGHFGHPSHPAAYGAWLDAYRSCFGKVDALMKPFNVDGKKCGTQFKTATPAIILAKLGQAEAHAKKQAEETLAKRDTA